MNLGVVFETTGRTSSSQIPQAQCLIPGTGKGVVTVRRKYDVTNEMRVTVQTFLGDAVVELVAGQVPYDQSFVYENPTHRSISRTTIFCDMFLLFRNFSKPRYNDSACVLCNRKSNATTSQPFGSLSYYLPREQDKIMSVWIGLVAICVTHPLCPRRVPRSCMVSVIFNDLNQNEMRKVKKNRENRRDFTCSTRGHRTERCVCA